MRAEINLEVLEELKSLGDTTNDPTFFSLLVEVFWESVELALEKLRIAAENADADALMKSAHALKSSCGNMGATRMYAVSKALEEDSRLGSLLQAEALIQALAVEFELIRKDFGRYL